MLTAAKVAKAAGIFHYLCFKKVRGPRERSLASRACASALARWAKPWRPAEVQESTVNSSVSDKNHIYRGARVSLGPLNLLQLFLILPSLKTTR